MSLKIIKSFRRESESPLRAILNKLKSVLYAISTFLPQKMQCTAVENAKECTTYSKMQLLQFCVQTCIKVQLALLD